MSYVDSLKAAYGSLYIDKAIENGWDQAEEHLQALANNDEIAITITHPANWLDEEQVETLFKKMENSD